MTELILHHYDASPFTQKALLMLGIKGASWHSVETPMMPPKPDLTCLTGGYRGTPVLQVGADVYIDSQRIAVELDRRRPEPALLPPAVAGLGLLLVKWSDVFFRCALYRALAQTAADWDPAFLADRRHLFHDIDFDAVADEEDHRAGQFRAQAALLEAQLADGRAFLAGDAPTLVDVQAWPFLWMSKGLGGTDALLAGLEHLAAWDERMCGIGEGERRPMGAADALALAREATPEALPAGATEEPALPATGTEVAVAPDDTRRGAVTGVLVHADVDEIVVRHRHERVGEVHVHFPRIGYRVRSQDA